jgi:hypothetical protein
MMGSKQDELEQQERARETAEATLEKTIAMLVVAGVDFRKARTVAGFVAAAYAEHKAEYEELLFQLANMPDADVLRLRDIAIGSYKRRR